MSRVDSRQQVTSRNHFTPSFQAQWQLQMADYITAIAFSPNGQWLAASSAAGDIWLGHPKADLWQLQPVQGYAVDAIAFSSDSQFFAATGQTGQVTIWRLHDTSHHPKVIFSKNLTQGWVDCLGWHPTAAIVAIATGSKVQLWTMVDQSLVAQLDFERSSVLALAWHPHGTHVAVGGQGGVSVWAAAHWAATPDFTPVPGASMTVRWSADGRYLASGNLDRTLAVVEWGHPPPWYMQGFPGKVRQVAWSEPLTKMGAPLLAAACRDAITIWEREATEAGVWRSRVLQQHLAKVAAIAFQPGTFTLASAGDDGALILWPKAKMVGQVLQTAAQGWGAMAWSPDGRQLVGGDGDGNLILWTQSQRGQGFQTHRALKR